jgi:two-component system response regulator GlrR
MAAGAIREDPFHRLNVVTLRPPSLAERRETLLANHFLPRSQKYRKTVNGLTAEALELLIAAPWPRQRASTL